MIVEKRVREELGQSTANLRNNCQCHLTLPRQIVQLTMLVLFLCLLSITLSVAVCVCLIILLSVSLHVILCHAYFLLLIEGLSTKACVHILPGAIEYLPQSVSLAQMFIKSLH